MLIAILHHGVAHEGEAIGKKHRRRGQWKTYVALKGALENELLSHVARLSVGSRFEIGFGRGGSSRGKLECWNLRGSG